jgi:hypothetical protein
MQIEICDELSFKLDFMSMTLFGISVLGRIHLLMVEAQDVIVNEIRLANGHLRAA